MILHRLGQLSSFGICRPNRATWTRLTRELKEVSSARRNAIPATLDQAPNNVDIDEDKPIEFSTSKAATWKAKYYREPKPGEHVWYTSHVMMASIGVFLIYFCILREENDIDEMLYRPLTENIEGMDKLYPGVDFAQKPDYVLYHEKEALKKKEKKLSQAVTNHLETRT